MKKIVNGELIDMTPDEISARQAEIITNSAAMLKSSILAALDKSDMVAIRCFKAGVPFPAEWQSYVTALRSGTLPTQPNYPEGT